MLHEISILLRLLHLLVYNVSISFVATKQMVEMQLFIEFLLPFALVVNIEVK
jgi:hypothetical protein